MNKLYSINLTSLLFNMNPIPNIVHGCVEIYKSSQKAFVLCYFIPIFDLQFNCIS